MFAAGPLIPDRRLAIRGRGRADEQRIESDEPQQTLHEDVESLRRDPARAEADDARWKDVGVVDRRAHRGNGREERIALRQGHVNGDPRLAVLWIAGRSRGDARERHDELGSRFRRQRLDFDPPAGRRGQGVSNSTSERSLSALVTAGPPAARPQPATRTGCTSSTSPGRTAFDSDSPGVTALPVVAFTSV